MSNYIIRIDLDKLTPNPLNEKIYSFNSTAHTELVKSIELNGLLEPICITGKHNTIVSGHRRYLAVKDLGWEDTDCRLIDVDNLPITTIEMNRYRKKTSTEILNEASILKSEYSKMVKRGAPKKGEKREGRNWTILSVSSRLGVSTTKLKKLMSIKKYQPDLLEQIDLGLISVGKAYSIIREKYILNGTGGRPKKDFQSQFSQLLDEYKPSLKQIVKVMKQKPTYKEEIKSSFN
jgi:ParB-like chromosome segregation protein Spo0J